MDFTVRLAGQLISIHSRYDLLYNYCRDYCVECSTPDISFSITQKEVEYERSIPDTQQSYTDEYLETLAALRKISEWLPRRNCLTCHGAAISYDDRGFLFTAPSGTGKSTHIRLWRKYLGSEVKIINGDKPLLSVEANRIRIHGSPWAGKEGWQRNRSADMEAICFLEQASANKISRLSPEEGVDRLLHQIYLPVDQYSMEKTLEMLELLLKSIPLYLLRCDISEDAVRCSYELLTGNTYNMTGEKA